jgi:diguanylate cyclase (GGDEF)-like protein
MDVSAMRMREATIAAGIWLTLGVGAFGETYVALTWSRPHRPGLAVLFAMAVVAALAVLALPREQIVRSRLREPFFLTWTLLDFAMLVVGTLLDAGTSSPLVLVFFIPVVFSSMSYPLGSVIAVGAVSVLSYLALALTAGGASAEYEGGFIIALVCTAAMSAWQAQNHNRQHRALSTASRTDPLTGCLNRRGFEERAAAEIETMARSGARGAILVFDIDHFKPVNDTFGHAAGDRLLCWFAATLEASVRPTDAVGRLGGDEFAAVFPDLEAARARESAERIAAALAEQAPASVGIAVFPDDGTNLEELTRHADGELYASREGRTPEQPAAGRFSRVGAHQIQQQRNDETLACLDRVERALVERRFLLHAQPIVDIATGITVQHELLLRMRDADGTLVAPGEFLPTAERHGLIGEIDRWVIERATQLAGGGDPMQLNLSARSIGDPYLLAHIEHCMERDAVAPGMLVFEITETAIVEDANAARVFVRRLHELGCQVALDDFGTGYGTFTYLKQIPVDYLKLDIEFVRDLRSNTASRLVVQAVISLARDFGLQTVAEGVEDAETLRLLAQLGVDRAQGFHIARPDGFELRPGDRCSPARTRARAGERPARAARRLALEPAAPRD